MIAIIGAGLTGLSAAYHLTKRQYHLFEQEPHPGGLCRSIHRADFTFDHTGHLLHIKHPHTHKLVQKLLPGKFNLIHRRSAIYYKNRYTPYPFQAHTYGLPREVIVDCVMGFIEAYCSRQFRKRSSANFKEWIYRVFGDGMARHFFIPYNEKLWQMSLDELTTDWLSWSVPRPTLAEVINGALGIPTPDMGYNATFYFPKQGGIEIVPQAFSQHIKNISCNKKLVSVNLAKRRITFADGETREYEKLISTMPLPQLLRSIEDLPSSYQSKSSKLRFVSVQNLNLGINRKNVSDLHWIYFPEPEYPFYRVGFYSNFSTTIAPRNASSLYVEVSARPACKRSVDALQEACMDGLKRCGILKRGDRVVATSYCDIEYAYVVFDRFRKQNLPGMHRYLNKHGVFSVGRYGSWGYLSMEDALLEGRILSRALL